MMNVHSQMLEKVQKRGAAYLALIDPEDQTPERAGKAGAVLERAGADFILVGGSIVRQDLIDKTVQAIKKSCRLPVIIFPGGSSQVSRYADALFFMSLMSGRNSRYLIDEQVKAAPLVKEFGTETIPVAYILIKGGQKVTTVERVSETAPLSPDNIEKAVAHCLAAKYLGMQMIYLEAGSGAERSVPEEMIRAIKNATGLPLIVGGGIRDPQTARKKVEAGAAFVVTGTILEERGAEFAKRIADAVHLR